MKNINEFVNDRLVNEAAKQKKLNFANLIDFCEKDTGLTPEDICAQLAENAYFDDDEADNLSVVKKELMPLFKGFENETFTCGCLSNNGYEGPLEKAFNSKFYTNTYDSSYMDFVEDDDYVDIEDGAIEASRIVDSTGRLMIIAELDPCYIFIQE